MAVLLKEALYGGGVLHQGHHDIAILSGIALLHDDLVAVVYPGVDHTVAFHPEHEDRPAAPAVEGSGRKGDVIVNILICQQRHTGGHGSHYGNPQQVALLIGSALHQLDGARF